jgi:hypothetical protein
MGKGDEWDGIIVPGQSFEHREVVVAKGRWDYQPRLTGRFKFRVHTQTGNPTVAIIEGMHLRDQKKDIEGTGRGGRQFPAGGPAAGQGFGYQFGSDEHSGTELVVGFLENAGLDVPRGCECRPPVVRGLAKYGFPIPEVYAPLPGLVAP